jgi:glycosyltransferase involved in cell wall biosynthesis
MTRTRVTLVNLWGRGGMLHYSASLAGALARRPGLEVSVLLPKGAPAERFPADVHRAFVFVPSEEGPRAWLRAPGLLATVLALARAVERTRPQVVHLNSSHPSLVLAMRGLARRHPVVATVHDAAPHPGDDDGLRKRMERRAIVRHAQRLAVHRETLAAQLLGRYPERRAEDVIVTPHGPYEFFAQEEEGAGGWGRKSPPTVLFFGRLQAYKGLSTLLEAAPLVRARVPDAHFVIAGQGRLPEGVAVLDEPWIEVHDRFIEDHEVAGLFRRAWLLVMPYREVSESGPLGVGWSFGLPVVASRVGSLRQAVEHRRTGLLVAPGDPVELANALIELLSDREKAERLGAEGRRRVLADESWDESARILEETYRSLAAAVGSRKRVP